MFKNCSLLVLIVLYFLSCQSENHKDNRVQAWPDNPHYLAWGDTPVFPLGATGYHSWTPISRSAEINFIEQLDRLAKVIDAIGSPHVCGFVRCLPYDPMNHLHDGAVSRVLQPWLKLEDGRYDLEHFEQAWEYRLREWLDAALKRRIVVSMEVWDDWSVTRGPGGAYDPGKGNAWNAHPFNPKNNINYDETILPAETSACNAPFYNTIPSKNNNVKVLNLQKKYVDHLLSIIKSYPNIILDISNESRAPGEWSRFWAGYIRKRIPSHFMIGEMPSTNRRDGGGECEHEFSPRNLCMDPMYSFVDVAQAVSRHEFGEPQRQALGGGERIFLYRALMTEAGTVMPLVVSKDYSRDSNGGDMVLWSRFISGAAAARFHRPAGDNPESVIDFQHEAIGRLGRFIAEVPFWQMQPDPVIILKLPEGSGANLLTNHSSLCIIQLIGATSGGMLQVDISPGTWTVECFDPSTGIELSSSEVSFIIGSLKLDIPAGAGHRIILLKKSKA
jgi:hypothetical protein